jgi:hypothetical protein
MCAPSRRRVDGSARTLTKLVVSSSDPAVGGIAVVMGGCDVVPFLDLQFLPCGADRGDLGVSEYRGRND